MKYYYAPPSSLAASSHLFLRAAGEVAVVVDLLPLWIPEQKPVRIPEQKPVRIPEQKPVRIPEQKPATDPGTDNRYVIRVSRFHA